MGGPESDGPGIKKMCADFRQPSAGLAGFPQIYYGGCEEVRLTPKTQVVIVRGRKKLNALGFILSACKQPSGEANLQFNPTYCTPLQLLYPFTNPRGPCPR